MSYLRAYAFHGVYPYSQNAKDAIGDCRFCGNENHFSIMTHTGMFRCFKCGAKGNLYVFLRLLWEKLNADFWRDSRSGWRNLKALAGERGIPSRTLRDYGVVWDPKLRHWVLPIFAPNFNLDDSLNQVSPRKLVNLKRWVSIDGRRQFHGTYTCSAHLFNWDRVLVQSAGSFGIPAAILGGASLSGHRRSADSCRTRILVCEGEWDALALIGTLGDLLPIVGTPGADTFKPEWADTVRRSNLGWDFLYDNDDAGIAGYSTIAERLVPPLKSPDAVRPTTAELGRLSRRTRWLIWGDRSLKKGYDIRDLCRDKNHDPDAVLAYLEPRLKRRKFHVEEAY